MADLGRRRCSDKAWIFLWVELSSFGPFFWGEFGWIKCIKYQVSSWIDQTVESQLMGKDVQVDDRKEAKRLRKSERKEQTPGMKRLFFCGVGSHQTGSRHESHERWVNQHQSASISFIGWADLGQHCCPFGQLLPLRKRLFAKEQRHDGSNWGFRCSWPPGSKGTRRRSKESKSSERRNWSQCLSASSFQVAGWISTTDLAYLLEAIER